MHAALNALSISNRSGTGRYVWGLIHGFVDQAFPDLQLSVFIPADFSIPAAWHKAQAIRFYSIPASTQFQRIYWEQRVQPSFVRRIKADLLHSPAFIAPVLQDLNVPQVITLHDLAYQKLPQTIPALRRSYLRYAITQSMRKAKVVLTDSKAIANELREQPNAPRRIVPVQLGVDSQRYHSHHRSQDEEILRQYGLHPPYFLCVGAQEPRKNLNTLVQAFNRSRERGLAASLVLVGRFGWMQDPHQFEQPGIKAIGFVPEEHLPALYRRAQCLLAPSLYEGFNLPAYEARACGIPILASDIPVHREVLGPDADYLPVQDVEAWAEKMLQAEGRRIERYSRIRTWSDVAAETYMGYRYAGEDKKEEGVA